MNDEKMNRLRTQWGGQPFFTRESEKLTFASVATRTAKKAKHRQTANCEKL